MGALMSKVAKLRRKVRKLKRENLALIIECNQTMVRNAELAEAKIVFAGDDGILYRLDGYKAEKLDG